MKKITNTAKRKLCIIVFVFVYSNLFSQGFRKENYTTLDTANLIVSYTLNF